MRPRALRFGPSLRVTATAAFCEGRSPAVSVTEHPERDTVRPLPCSTDAAVTVHSGCGSGESR